MIKETSKLVKFRPGVRKINSWGLVQGGLGSARSSTRSQRLWFPRYIDSIKNVDLLQPQFSTRIDITLDIHRQVLYLRVCLSICWSTGPSFDSQRPSTSRPLMLTQNGEHSRFKIFGGLTYVGGRFYTFDQNLVTNW